MTKEALARLIIQEQKNHDLFEGITGWSLHGVDPWFFVWVFSDRIEFARKTPNGPVVEAMSRKQFLACVQLNLFPLK